MTSNDNLKLPDELWKLKRYGDLEKIMVLSGISRTTLSSAFKYKICSKNTLSYIALYYRLKNIEERLEEYWIKNGFKCKENLFKRHQRAKKILSDLNDTYITLSVANKLILELIR